MDCSVDRLRDRDMLTLCVLALLGLGIVMVQSAATVVTPDLQSAARWFQWSERGTRHALYAVLAVLTFTTVSRIDYRRLAREKAISSPCVWALLLAAVACLIVLIPGIGTAVNGSRRWLTFGPVTLQPSELAKWAMVLFLAWRLSRPGATETFGRYVTTCAVVGFVCLLVVIEDFGTAALIGTCCFAMLLAGRSRAWHLLITAPPALGAAFWFVFSEPYRWRRMTAFLDPYAAAEREGYHMIQSLYSFAGGGLLGRGLGNGVQKLGYLPEDTTDFIFAVVCEELGLFGAMLVVACYVCVLVVAWSAMRKADTGFGKLLAFGVGSMIGLQACINMAVATASVPTKGMPLPLVSAGGTGLVVTCGALGLLASVLRYSGESSPVVEEGPASRSDAASEDDEESDD